MKTITIQLRTAAYQALADAIQANPELKRRDLTVLEWIEEELNNNTDVIIEMLLEQI